MKIKVCGMKDALQVETLYNLGADYCGLIFFKGSERCISEKDEGFIMDLDRSGIKKVGVFVNETIPNVLKFAADYKLTAVQLHGDESVEYCRQIRNEIPLIKVFRLQNATDVDNMLSPFQDVADYFLFDNGKGGYGGTGQKFDWNILLNAKVNKPFFLSGGIGAGDVEAVKNFHHPFLFAIDINSRFETSPGYKDLKEVEYFINAVKEKNSYNGTKK